MSRRTRRFHAGDYEVSLAQNRTANHGQLLIETRRFQITIWVVQERFGVRIEFPIGRTIVVDGFELNRPTKNQITDDEWIVAFIVNTVVQMEGNDSVPGQLGLDLSRGLRQLWGNSL